MDAFGADMKKEMDMELMIAAFHKDLNLAIEKEIRRIGKRIVNT